MTNRQCYPCTAGCEGWLTAKINDVVVKPQKPCVHCTANGCGIYENRPVKPCVEFKCGWLMEQSPLPESMRPDQCGAIVLLDRKWNGRRVIKGIPTGKSIPEKTLNWLKAYTRESSVPLIFGERLYEDGKYLGIKRIGYGPPDFLRAVEAEIAPEDVMAL